MRVQRHRLDRQTTAALLAMSLGCAHASAPAPPRAPLVDPTLAPLVAQVERLRGLTLKTPVKVRVLSPEAFARAASGLRTDAPFYDDPNDLIGISDLDAQSAQRREVSVVMGLDQALLAQAKPDGHVWTDDAALALSAARAGDALLTARLWVASQGLAPASVEAAQHRRWLMPPTDQLTDGLSEVEVLELINEAGPRFIATLYAQGGFAAVNRTLSDPPTSTAEVLHPERYLRGERWAALHFPRPTFAEGLFERRDESQFTEVPTAQAGTALGELRLRAILDQCLPHPEAVAQAEALESDGFQKGFVVLRWVSRWRTPDEAQRFEALARAKTACLSEALDTVGFPVRPFTKERWIERRGRTVIFVEGKLLPGELDGIFAAVSGANGG